MDRLQALQKPWKSQNAAANSIVLVERFANRRPKFVDVAAAVGTSKTPGLFRHKCTSEAHF